MLLTRIILLPLPLSLSEDSNEAGRAAEEEKGTSLISFRAALAAQGEV
jgi:hypothetical protein